MIHVAIVEDAAFDRKILRDCLAQYTAETGEAFDTTEYSSGEDFLSRCSGEPELIFMDIVMEELDGLSTARRLRLKNEKSLLIFVTSMLQYAVQGYSVDAMDFLVKPVSYPIFKLCLDRFGSVLAEVLCLKGRAVLSCYHTPALLQSITDIG